jgi:hypothetical protein
VTGLESPERAAMIRNLHLHRGAVGSFFEIAFYVFNIVMAAWLVLALAKFGSVEATPRSELVKAVAEFGVAFRILVVMFVWMAGDVILGLLTLVMRERKAGFEEHAE